jgi:competence ComEA-like helix-hairpin-helix protein
MSSMESKGFLTGGMALLFLALVRLGLQAFPHGDSLTPTGDSQLEALMGQSRSLQEEEANRSRPLAPGERIDPNRATQSDLDRLPGVGPATAAAIESNRDQLGGFHEKEDLLRVPGIGPAKLEKMAAFLDFSAGVPLDLSRRSFSAPGSGRSFEDRASRGGGSGYASTARSDSPGLGIGVIDVNRASSKELQQLPGIGPALAARILESRQKEGPFRGPNDLLRVKGIGEAKLARVSDLIGFGG